MFRKIFISSLLTDKTTFLLVDLNVLLPYFGHFINFLVYIPTELLLIAITLFVGSIIYPNLYGTKAT